MAQQNYPQFFDPPIILDAAVTPIPAVTDPPLQVIAELEFFVSRVMFYDGIGEWIGLYIGPVGQEVLFGVVGGQGPQEIKDIQLIPKSRISVRSLTTSPITSGEILCKFFSSK